MRTAPKESMVPIDKVWIVPFFACISYRQPSNSCKIGVSRLKNSSPSGVKRLPRLDRSMSWRPTLSSSFFICALKADCVIFAAWAATVKLRHVPYTMKFFNCWIVGNSILFPFSAWRTTKKTCRSMSFRWCNSRFILLRHLRVQIRPYLDMHKLLFQTLHLSVLRM